MLQEKNKEVGCFPYIAGYTGALLILFVLGGFPNVFKGLALYFSKNQVEAILSEHYCPDDHVYVYNFQLGDAIYKGSYEGYLSSVEAKIPEDEGCEGKLKTNLEISVRFVKAFPRWNEPASLEYISTFGFIFNILLFLGIWIAIGEALAKNVFQ